MTGNDFLMGECIQQGKIEKLNDKYEIFKLQMKVRIVVRIATTRHPSDQCIAHVIWHQLQQNSRIIISVRKRGISKQIYDNLQFNQIHFACVKKSCLCGNAQCSERTNILVAIRPACMTKGYAGTSFGVHYYVFTV